MPFGACKTIDPQCVRASRGFSVSYFANPAEVAFGSHMRRKNPRIGDYYLKETPIHTGVVNWFGTPLIWVQRQYGTPITMSGKNGEHPFAYYPGATYNWQDADMVFDINNFTFVTTGYYKPAATGTYTWCGDVDDVANFYFGSADAFACGQGKRRQISGGKTPLINVWYTTNVRGREFTVCKDVDLVKGLYYPFRSVTGNYGESSGLNLTISGPGITRFVTKAEGGPSGYAYPAFC